MGVDIFKAWLTLIGAVLLTFPGFVEPRLVNRLYTPNLYDSEGNFCADSFPTRTLQCPIFGISVRTTNASFLTQNEIEAKCASYGVLRCSQDQRLFPDGSCGNCPADYPIEVDKNGNFYCENETGAVLSHVNPFNCGQNNFDFATHHRPCYSKANAPETDVDNYYGAEDLQGELTMSSCYDSFSIPPENRISTIIHQYGNEPVIFQFPIIRDIAQPFDHGYIQCPVEPSEYSFVTGWWIALYAFYGGGVAILATFAVYRSALISMKKRGKQLGATTYSSLEKPSRPQNNEIKKAGYKDDWFGQFAFYVLVALSLGLLSFLIFLILDQYGMTYPVCSEASTAACKGSPTLSYRGGIECASACIFSWRWTTGTHRLWPYERHPGGVEQVYGIFYISWIFSMIWWLLLKIYWDKLPVWFRIPTSIKDATIIFCSVVQEEGVRIEHHERSAVGRIVRFCEKQFEKVFGKRMRDHACRVESDGNLKYFEFQYLRYCWSDEHSDYVISSFAPQGTFSYLKAQADKGVDDNYCEKARYYVGLNKIDVKIPAILTSLVEEFFQLFYIYQVGLLIVWYVFLYWSLATILLLVIIGSSAIKVYIKRKAEKQIKDIAEFCDDVLVLRNGEWRKIRSDMLVPYDIVQLETGAQLYADCLFLRGRCVVNESSLTGEPTPVPKVSVPNSEEPCNITSISNARYMLMSGTVIESVSHVSEHEKAVAMVCATGARTQQGSLLRTILFPPPLIFKYDDHIKLVFALLLIVSFIMFFFILYIMGFLYTSIIYALFTIGNILSPLIPAVFLAGQARAATRLRSKEIYCVNLYRTFVAAKVKVCCFDKTGTLTTAGIEYHNLYEITPGSSTLKCVHKLDDAGRTSRQIMGCCHELDVVPIESDSDIANTYRFVGNEIDTSMFGASKFNLKDMGAQPVITEPITGDNLKVLRRFEFERSTMTMSVIVKNLRNSEVYVFSKGSSEGIENVCVPDSVPSGFHGMCKQLASEGYYVLAMASKRLAIHNEEVNSFTRKDIESGLEMKGLLVFSNDLKHDTTECIRELREGGVRPVMITGDSLVTACKVARDCDLSISKRLIVGNIVGTTVRWEDYDSGEVIDKLEELIDELKSNHAELGITGQVLEYLKMSPDKLLPINIEQVDKGELAIRSIIPYTRLFGRMKPDQKVQIVKYYMELGVTAMCGDGANDCAALRMSHCGLALGNSNRQATIVAPFNTPSVSIKSMITLLIEGRAALATSNIGYKRLILYGQTILALKIVSYFLFVNSSEIFWLLMDSFINCGLAFILLRTSPAKKLSPNRPTSKLMGYEIFTSIFIHTILIHAVMYLSLVIMKSEDWFHCKEFDPNLANHAFWWTMGDNYEAGLFGFVALFQLATMGLILNFGHDYRRVWYKNWSLLIVTLVFIIVLILFLFLDGTWLNCLARFNCGDHSLLVWWRDNGESIGTGGGIAPEGCACDTQIAYSPTCENEYTSCDAAQYNQRFHHNIYPVEFRFKLIAFLFGYLIFAMLVEGFGVVGAFRQYLRKKSPKTSSGPSYIV